MKHKHNYSLLKHLDFLILDFICIELAFFIACQIRQATFLDLIERYMFMAAAVAVAFLVIVMFWNIYSGILRRGFGAEVKRRIMLGSFVLSSGYYDAYYLKALRVKAMIKKAFDEAFAKYDLILGPVAPTTAPKLGSSLSDPIKMYLGDIYTISVNLAGLPGISVPCGKDSKGLPIGVQMIGDCFKEKNLIRAAYSYEQARGEFK